VLSFINLKGGVGKTTTAVATAEILAHDFRRHVLLVDLDPQTNASLMLIPEERWIELDNKGRTVAQLFDDRVNPGAEPRFQLEDSIVHRVSTIAGGIPRLDLLSSSMRLTELQERIPLIALTGNFTSNPLEILRTALEPVKGRYDYVIIDCPPSLGPLTKNGLRMSTSYVIPTVPDIVSTWGIFQIVDNIERFARDLDRPLPPLGIVATKVQNTAMHHRVMDDLQHGRLARFGEPGGLQQPPLLHCQVRASAAAARGADMTAEYRTLKEKYGEAYDDLYLLANEIRGLCEK
jgi:chromosome partitioning protein